MKSDTLKALAGLQLAYKRELDKAQLGFYVEMLQDIPPVLLEKAVKKLIMTNKFLPTISEIRQAAELMADKAAGTREKDADEAWYEVRRQIAAAGYAGKPEFTSREITEAVARMGWKDICLTPEADTAILRAQFRNTYLSVLARSKERRIDLALGIKDRTPDRLAAAREPPKLEPAGDILEEIRTTTKQGGKRGK